MKSIVTLAAIATCLSGCIGPSASLGIADVGSMPAPIVRNAWSVQVTDTLPARATVLGAVEGTSCKNKVWDPTATEAKALEQVQIKAAALGATAVHGVSYQKGGLSMLTNCWESITATATAYR